jgi:hypothetical protein
LVATSLAIGLLGWWVLSLMSDALRQDQHHASQIGGPARWVIQHRSILPLLASLSLLCGMWLALASSRRPIFWLVWSLAMLWLIVLFAIVLLTFIGFLVRLYTYQPI